MRFICLAVLLATLPSLAQSQAIKVYLLGTFHFAQTDSTYNVLEPKHQASITALIDLVAQYRPDKVFVERQPEYEFQNKIDSLYSAYVQGGRLRWRNEIFQIGFRLARQLGHDRVYQCDHPGQYGWLFRKAREYAAKNGQLPILRAEGKGTAQRADNLIDEDSLRQHLSLLDYLKWLNGEEIMTSSHAFYLANFPQLGSQNYYDYDDDDTLLGAEILADWYRRNIMIYTKMINQLTYDEEAIFLVMGSDHIPILRELFTQNPHFEVVDPADWLK